MNKYGIYKYKIKAKLNRETDEYTITRKTNNEDYFETLIFALEAIVEDIISYGLVKNKKDFIEKMKNSYDIVKEDLENGNN